MSKTPLRQSVSGNVLFVFVHGAGSPALGVEVAPHFVGNLLTSKTATEQRSAVS
ncbi:hypothetical protein [Rhodococcus sp. 05-340-2]|uniref:hypothetical protein n=1 Tax=Rhodococcus sp. 05-340-2 TaxID=2022504 RepID=UPI0015C5A4F3|nr:hypothetical protein [Rhodococcus sp. 05-340-2]